MRYAIKFGYLGMDYHGSQRQPDLRTVEGEIINCLQEHKVIEDLKESQFQLGSRTDTGVSALGNVMAFNSDFKKEDILNILNSKLSDCWFYGKAEVDVNFNPRFAKMRWYRYHLAISEKLDLELLKIVIPIFQGEYDFKNFANPQVKDTIRTMEKISITESDDWLIIDFYARSFLWNQLRRLVSSWVRYAKGEVAKGVLENALNDPSSSYDFGLAPPEPLFLMDIEYDFGFEIDHKLLQKAKIKLFEQWHKVRIREKLFEYLIEKFNKD